MSYRITICLPCYGRPERTKRAIECIVSQNATPWQAFIIGDGCPDFQKLVASGYMEDLTKQENTKGNSIIYFNFPSHTGGCGYQLMNHAIKHATGKYFVWMGNDDIILPDHFSNYLSGIEGTDYDFVYYDSWIAPLNERRSSYLANSRIGHSEIIVRTDFLKQMQPHTAVYGHDWEIIYEMMRKGKHTKAASPHTSYWVMRLPGAPLVDTID